MSASNQSIHGMWSSQMVFVLAATGSAVGLGNIWRFPYMVGEYGGGLFVLIYLGCIALIGVPVMMAEVMLGRMGRHSPITSIRIIAERNGLSRHWHLLGWMGVVAGLLILSFYSVIAGWSMAYIFRSGAGVFDGITAEGVSAIFSDLVSEPEKLLAWHTLFMIMTYVVVSKGVVRGLEVAVKILMPMLFILLLVLLAYSMNTGYFNDGIQFMFFPETSRIADIKGLSFVILAALGQAFFTLSLGAGAIMAYGAYLPRSTSIFRVTMMVVIMDTLVAIVAGMIIFPIVFANNLDTVVFANGLDARYGPGLVFQTLPLAFGHMPWGDFFAALFFLLLVIAAWTSSISLLEPAVAYLVERWSLARDRAAMLMSVIVWILGLGTIFSFNIWSDVRPLESFEIFADKTVYHLLDFLASNILLPLGGVLIAVFVGWRLNWKTTEDELAMGKEYCSYAVWRISIRYIAPVLLIIVFIYSLLKVIGQLSSAP